MDGQNFNNDLNNNQNGNAEQPAQQNSYYQDYTANVTPNYVAPQSAPQNETNGVAVVSLVMGIISIVFSCCYGGGIIFGIIGIICAVVAKKKEA